MCCKSENGCNLVINEVNTGTPANLKNNDFIELKMLCENAEDSNYSSLQGTKIIGISADKETATIDLVVNLWNEKVQHNGYFTIGNFEKANMRPTSQSFVFRNKLTSNTQSVMQFLNKGNVNLHAIAIVYKKGYSFPEFVLNKKNSFVNINSEIENLIKTNLVDLIVYGRKAPYDNCNLFINLCPVYGDKAYILREFDNNKGTGKDRTLNRCAIDARNFLPEHFKLGSATPGENNDCTGAHFYLEQFLLQLPNIPLNVDSCNVEETDILITQSDLPQCTSTIDASFYNYISDDAIEQLVQQEISSAEESICTDLQLGANTGIVADQIERITTRKRQRSPEMNYDEEWQTTKYFM